jgi:hypothetical protein
MVDINDFIWLNGVIIGGSPMYEYVYEDGVVTSENKPKFLWLIPSDV